MLPGFLKDRAEITGADLGTAVHMIMENLDFTAENNYESIKALADNLVKKGFIREEYSGKIDLNGIVRFLDSDLYKRMKKAALNNKLYREQPFVMRMESCDDKGETYLVQGIIDAYFEEDGECVIVDYKTDKLTEDELLRKYAVQLNIYAKAVGAIKEIRIKEKILYSFNLSKALLLGKGGP
jgi:ATP-dependent helicase/nuclease subunit A